MLVIDLQTLIKMSFEPRVFMHKWVRSRWLKSCWWNLFPSIWVCLLVSWLIVYGLLMCVERPLCWYDYCWNWGKTFLIWYWLDEHDEDWEISFPDFLFDPLEGFVRVLHVFMRRNSCIGPAHCHASVMIGLGALTQLTGHGGLVIRGVLPLALFIPLKY